jgi:cation diffusion facilitator family transporter
MDKPAVERSHATVETAAADRRPVPGRAEWAPRCYTLLAMGAAVLTMGLKFVAFLITDSVGLFSDAAESGINLAAAIVAFAALTVAARPADEEHAYGHTKAEYFSSGLEGAMILVAGAAIAMTAINRFLHPQPLENLGIGLAVTLVATAINGGVGLILLRAAHRLRSITLRADGQHLMTDVWTSAGVVVGVLLVGLTGWLPLDPIVALLVALNIAWTAVRLMRESALGLLDTALPAEDLAVIARVLEKYRAGGVRFHALRTRASGQRRFMSVHVLVPGLLSVQRGHALCERIEQDLHAQLPMLTVFTHLEPTEDPVSMDDQKLDREPCDGAGAAVLMSAMLIPFTPNLHAP